MYDARERAIRDRKWEIDSAKREGKADGLIGTAYAKRKGSIKRQRPPNLTFAPSPGNSECLPLRSMRNEQNAAG